MEKLIDNFLWINKSIYDYLLDLTVIVSRISFVLIKIFKRNFKSTICERLQNCKLQISKKSEK